MFEQNEIKRQFSVTQKIKETKQPRGGYLNINLFKKIELGNPNFILEDMKLENYSPAIIGLCVDYLTRFILSENIEDSFKISKYGAKNLNMIDEYNEYTNNIKGLDNQSIYFALKLCEFDVAYRVSPIYYVSKSEKPNDVTIKHIKIMVENSLSFFQKYGPITKDGFDFKVSNEKNGYSNTITSGDGDFLTKETLWDFKVSKKSPTKDHTLQLIMYFLMGKKSEINHFKNLKNIGIYNPRLNTVYTYNVSEINQEILKEISLDVIEYDDISFIDNF